MAEPSSSQSRARARVELEPMAETSSSQSRARARAELEPEQIPHCILGARLHRQRAGGFVLHIQGRPAGRIDAARLGISVALRGRSFEVHTAGWQCLLEEHGKTPAGAACAGDRDLTV